MPPMVPADDRQRKLLIIQSIGAGGAVPAPVAGPTGTLECRCRPLGSGHVRTWRCATGDSASVATDVPAVARDVRGTGLDRRPLADPQADFRPRLHTGPGPFSDLRPVCDRRRGTD